MERVCRLMNKFYREMLCITRHEGMTYITSRIGPAGLDHVQDRAFFSYIPRNRIVLSLDLVAWILVEGIIPCFFTNFITSPELSGPLYISPDIYHTQISEYLLWAFSLCINQFPYCYSVRHYYCDQIPDRSLWEHLSRALTTKMIFCQLRLINSDLLIRDYSPSLMLDTLEIIIKWLQVSVSECDWQTPRIKISICAGTWFRATERLVRSLPGWTSSVQSSPLSFRLKFEICVYHELCDQCNPEKKYSKETLLYDW